MILIGGLEYVWFRNVIEYIYQRGSFKHQPVIPDFIRRVRDLIAQGLHEGFSVAGDTDPPTNHGIIMVDFENVSYFLE